MLLQLALIFLCVAQIMHFSQHWLTLTRSMLADRNHRTLAKNIDWNRPKYGRRSAKKNKLLDWLSR